MTCQLTLMDEVLKKIDREMNKLIGRKCRKGEVGLGRDDDGCRWESRKTGLIFVPSLHV